MKKEPEELAKILADCPVRLGSIWNHIKSNRSYIVMSVCLREEDLEVLVVYTSVEYMELGLLIPWARPWREFVQRFLEVME